MPKGAPQARTPAPREPLYQGGERSTATGFDQNFRQGGGVVEGLRHQLRTTPARSWRPAGRGDDICDADGRCNYQRQVLRPRGRHRDGHLVRGLTEDGNGPAPRHAALVGVQAADDEAEFGSVSQVPAVAANAGAGDHPRSSARRTAIAGATAENEDQDDEDHDDENTHEIPSLVFSTTIRVRRPQRRKWKLHHNHATKNEST